MEEKEPEGFRENVRKAIKNGGGPKIMASKTGIPIGTINKYVAMTSAAPLANVMKICEANGLTVDALLSGNHRSESETEALAAFSARPVEEGLARSTTMITLPRYDVQAAAGDGIIPISENSEESGISIARSFLRNIGAQPASCVILETKGDSMLPAIPGGSLLIVDRSKTEIEDDMVFVFRVGPGIKVKRAVWRIDGNLDLVSDNEKYPPETYGPDRADEIAPIGQVMLILRHP